ncbi:MAG: DNA polymerase III subunit delta, partial [Pseudoruegeria sp.]
AVGLYDDPPTRVEIESELAQGGLNAIEPGAMTDLEGLSRVLGPGDFRQTIEKLSLYKLQDTTPVSSEDVLACAPTSTEASLDDVLNIVAEGRSTEIGPILAKLGAQGVQPVGLCIGAMRHFRTLHAASADPKGPSAGMSRVRPPVFGPRRDRMIRQAQGWGPQKLEQAITLLLDTDLQLRSTAKSPDMALMERALIRLAMMGRR